MGVIVVENVRQGHVMHTRHFVNTPRHIAHNKLVVVQQPILLGIDVLYRVKCIMQIEHFVVTSSIYSYICEI